VLADDRACMALELCPGGSLGDRLHRQGALPVTETRDIGVASRTRWPRPTPPGCCIATSNPEERQ
jgi:hypothetical protein